MSATAEWLFGWGVPPVEVLTIDRNFYMKSIGRGRSIQVESQARRLDLAQRPRGIDLERRPRRVDLSKRKRRVEITDAEVSAN